MAGPVVRSRRLPVSVAFAVLCVPAAATADDAVTATQSAPAAVPAPAGAPASATDAVAAAAPGAGATTAAPGAAEFRRLIDLQEYPQAVDEARRLLTLAEATPGPGDENLQVALMNLALAEYLNQDYVQAEASYLRVIELIESSGKRNDTRLARAQAGLANTYYSGKRYDLAVARYEQAIGLVRRNQGLFSDAQVPYLEKFSDALTQLNRVEDALRVQRYILKAVERKHGRDSVQYAEALASSGRWLTSVRAYEGARGALRRSISIIEGLEGENSAALISPLTALGDCARKQLLDPEAELPNTPEDARRTVNGQPVSPAAPEMSASTVASEGQRAYERAVAIATAQAPQSSLTIADTRTQLGDWFQSRRQFERAAGNYQLAWTVATGAKFEGRPLEEALFGRPVRLVYRPPYGWDRYANQPGDRVTVRVVQLAVTVDARGTVSAVRVTDDAGDPDLGERAADAADDAIYRPRYERGAAVPTTDVEISQPFYVRVDTEAAPPANAAPQPAPAQPPVPAPEPAQVPAPDEAQAAPPGAG